jgi:hypothetical protein
MKNSKTRRVTLTSIMGTKEFKDGFNDARNGNPFCDNWTSNNSRGVSVNQWHYERGRMFYVFLKSIKMTDIKWKDGRRVTLQAQKLYSDGMKEGFMI